jgi:hypothetical protein
LEPDVLELIKYRWPFFTAMRKDAINHTNNGFQPTNIFKTSFQTLYNSLKGGLDAYTEQMSSISPGIKVGFEQKYVMCLMTAPVTNAWRSFQLLQYGIEIESMNNTKVKQSIKRHGTHLKDFVFQLALSLIRSADKRM